MTSAERAQDRMVQALRSAGRLGVAAIEEAFRAVPRHLFLPDLGVAEAYLDEAVAVQRIGGVATSSASQPSMMAIMLEQLGARPGERVLEIGAGTGYNAALLARIVGVTGSVTALDIDPQMIDSAERHLAAAGVTGVHLVCADGALGHPPSAPYDRIMLTVGSSDVRPEWVAQLAPGGRLVLPLALRGSQLSVALDLGPDGRLHSDTVRGCAFIRLRGAGAAPETVLPVATGCSVQVAEDTERAPEPAAVAAALATPGPVRPAGVVLGPQDVWDGFGLWLALRDPGVVRLLLDDDREPGDDDPAPIPAGPAGAMFPVGTGYAGLALPGPGPGLALVGPVTAGNRWPRAVGVHAFGSGAAEPAARLLAALVEWDAVGRPRATGLHLVIVQRPVVDPPPGPVISLPSAVVTATWPGLPPTR